MARRIKMSKDESLDECRQMQTSVDESKNISLIRGKEIHGPISLFMIMQQ